MIYENVVEEFNKKGCKLLVTKEEYNNIKQEKSKLLQQLMSEKDENKRLMLYNRIKENMDRDKSIQDQIIYLFRLISDLNYQ